MSGCPGSTISSPVPIIPTTGVLNAETLLCPAAASRPAVTGDIFWPFWRIHFPAATSPPRTKMFFGSANDCISTSHCSFLTYSSATTASAPVGIRAPVNTLTAVPGVTWMSIAAPAAMEPTRRNLTGFSTLAPSISRDKTA
ncbi:MAG: hypothetical protein A4E66_02325 [Syntrophus sp. PtaB.Bin001]|nr:MAG: hypothetical protein A4E66_02325 [Syntrophus sp. PtaB.Bin001]